MALNDPGRKTWPNDLQTLRGAAARHIVVLVYPSDARQEIPACHQVLGAAWRGLQPSPLSPCYDHRFAACRPCADLQEGECRWQSRRVVERRRHCFFRVRREGAGKLSGTVQSSRQEQLHVNATCATASGRAAQTATVRQVGENRYSGSFYNSEYGISGVMHVVVRGTSQTVRLISDSASAVINLSR